MGDGAVGGAGAPPGSGAVPPVGGEVLRDEDDLAQRRRAGRRRRGGRRPRPGPRRATASAACPGRTGWRRSRRCGHSPRRPSRRPRARGRRGGAARGGRRRGSRRRPARCGPAPSGDGDGAHRCARRDGSGRARTRPPGPPRGGRRAARRRSARPCSRSRPGAPRRGAVSARLQDGLDRLLAGRLDEGAGVDDDEVGLVGVTGAVVSLRLEVALRACRSPPGSWGTPGSAASTDPRSRTLLAPGRLPPGDGARQARRGGPNVPDRPAPGARRPERRGRDLNPRTRLPRSTH